MEKENLELSETPARKPETRRSKRRQPEAIGSVAIEPETTEPDRGRRPAVEARWLHSAPPERIGQMLMSAEAKPAAAPAKSKPEKSPDSVLPPEISSQKVETLNRADLMSLSEKIILDGSSLRQIYETHLIGERGLRRLVAEYLRGGDLRQALRREVVERERDFERDPAMRDINSDQLSIDANPNVSQKAALDKLLEQADASTDGVREEVAFFKARAKYEAKELHQHKQRRRSLDIALATVILMLVLLVIALFMRRT